MLLKHILVCSENRCRPSGLPSDFPLHPELTSLCGNWVVPPGLKSFLHLAQRWSAGLSWIAPPGLVSCRSCSTGFTRRVVLTYTLKRYATEESNLLIW